MPAPIEVHSLLRPRPSRLSLLAQQLGERHGPARPSEDPLVEKTAKRLAATGGNLSTLDLPEKKAALDLLWRRRGLWIAQPGHVEYWLEWAEAEWKPRIAEKRVARRYCAISIRAIPPRSWSALGSRRGRLCSGAVLATSPAGGACLTANPRQNELAPPWLRATSPSCGRPNATRTPKSFFREPGFWSPYWTVRPRKCAVRRS